ncbi:FCHO1 protein, partial [Copsychus sechellarum]|nr:FCHO1 protein [Copsychus sechellarum]
PPQDSLPSAALFGPPLESAFESEEFPGEDFWGEQDGNPPNVGRGPHSARGRPAAPRSYALTSSSSPFSSSSPENVEDSGLDSPSHPAPGPSPDSRPWTPQSPKPDPAPPASSAPRPPEPPNFAVFSAAAAPEGLWGDAGVA